jgi:hypothetical protein
MTIRNNRRTGIPAIPALSDPEVYAILQALRQVLVRNEDITAPMAQATGAWEAYTPQIVPFSGAYTSVTSRGRYKQFGKTVHFTTDFTIISKGTAAGYISLALPVGPVREFTPLNVISIVDGSNAYISYANRADQVALVWTNSSYGDPHADGRRLFVSGTYEVE